MKCVSFFGTTLYFAMMTSFGSPNLHLKEFLYGPTYPPDFVFLALTGAEIKELRIWKLRAHRARNFQTLFSERVKKCMSHYTFQSDGRKLVPIRNQFNVGKVA